MVTQSELEYNRHRCIQLLNLPPSTEKEVREFLGGIQIKSIKLNESLDSAIIYPATQRNFEDNIKKLDGKDFKDNTVVAKQGANPLLLGLAHIPMTYSDKNFKEMCENSGAVEYAYIMRSSKGYNKGYGIVEFKGDEEQVKKIREEFDWKDVNGHILHADFVDPAVQVSYELMQSKCLLITGMPEDFTDVSKLREICGCVTSPVYCQIIVKDEKSLGYGIVEYRTLEDAEETWLKLRNEKIEGADVVISFCIPGKSAVVINNRIVWKYGDKSKSSLLPDPVTAKPVIAGNPIVISLSKMNPDFFAALQQAYVSQMMSPVNRPGLLGPAPSLPLSPMMNPNMQLGLLIMLAIHIQTAKKEKFTGVLAKQLNTLSEQDIGSGIGARPSILGDPMTGQANVILTSLKQQLNQVPLKDDDGNELEDPTELEENLKYIVKKFVANGRYLNLSLLSNLGQLLVSMKQSGLDGPGRGTGTGLLSTPALKGQSLLGPMPGGGLLGSGISGAGMGGSGVGESGIGGTGGGLMPTPNIGNKGGSLLGDAPNMGGRNAPLMGNAPGRSNNSNNTQAIAQAMGLGGMGSSSMNNISQTLLGQISQGLVHQIGQNLMYQLSVNNNNNQSNKGNQLGGSSGGGAVGGGKGLLGDVPQGSASGPTSAKNKMPSKNSLLGEPPNQFKGNSLSQTPLDQGSWKASDNRWGGGTSNYESGYGNKSNMGGSGVMGSNYNDYSYGQDSYSQDMGGNYGGGYGGGYTENDFYNYQQQMYSMYDGTSGSYTEYTSNNFGSGFVSGGGSGGMTGVGNNYGMGGGMLSNQSSGVNFQDGQSFGKGSTSNGLGQDSARFGGGDGYGGNMGYGYGSGREDMGDGTYDSYRSINMGSGYNTGMNDGMSSGMAMSSGMSGMGNNSSMGVMGSGMGMMGAGSSMGSTSNMGMTGFGNSYSTSTGLGNASNTTTSVMGGTSGGMADMTDSYTTGMGSGRMGMGSRSTVAGGSSMGMMGTGSSYMSGGNVGASGSSGNKMGTSMSGTSMTQFVSRDQNSSYYQNTGSTSSGASGLLPAPGKYLSPGQKRTYNQFLPRQDTNTESTDYVGQHSQGLGGHYMESFKRSRLY